MARMRKDWKCLKAASRSTVGMGRLLEKKRVKHSLKGDSQTSTFQEVFKLGKSHRLLPRLLDKYH